MINHGIQYSNTRPNDIEITANAVFLATNITPYEKEIEDRIVSGYQYNCIEYTKDEYLVHQDEQLASLAEQLAAAKILLGVD